MSINIKNIENNDTFCFINNVKEIKKYIKRNNINISEYFLENIISDGNIFVIKKNNVLGLIIFENKFTNNDKIMVLNLLHFEINSYYIYFINFLFKYYVKILKIYCKNNNNFLFKIIKKYELSWINNIEEDYIIININSNIYNYYLKYDKNKNNLEKIGYLYIIKEREFYKSKESVYKIGCTSNIIRRVKQYPKDSILIYSIINENYIEIERKWLKQLNNNNEIIKRNDIGREYFECNYLLLIDELRDIIDLE